MKTLEMKVKLMIRVDDDADEGEVRQELKSALEEAISDDTLDYDQEEVED